ncbi:MAG TPA: hypothetical protein VN840_11420 [Streptosporangiaceae bacterium]|nr:hypothetical protein [Streptosporangiaceae bacterium]
MRPPQTEAAGAARSVPVDVTLAALGAEIIGVDLPRHAGQPARADRPGQRA